MFAAINLKKYLHYQYILLCLLVGYSLGTFTLLVPLRGLLNYLRDNAFSETMEKVSVLLVIILLVLVTLYLSKILFDLIKQSKSVTIKILVFFIPAACFFFSVWLFFQPEIINKGQNQINEKVSAQFTIGPYPQEAKLRQLKTNGYDGIVSFLHPLVVPFEPVLINELKKQCETAGLEFISIPLLPWVDNNKESLDSLVNFVNTTKGKYYMHCYLGKDRVNSAKRIILNAIEDDSKLASEFGNSARKLDEIEMFERGKTHILAPGIYYTPYPTDEEFLSFVVAAEVKNVVSFLDPKNPEDIPWIEKEKGILNNYGIPFHNIPISENSKSELIISNWENILKMEKPIILHHFLTDKVNSIQFLEVVRKYQEQRTNVSK